MAINAFVLDNLRSYLDSLGDEFDIFISYKDSVLKLEKANVHLEMDYENSSSIIGALMTDISGFYNFRDLDRFHLPSKVSDDQECYIHVIVENSKKFLSFEVRAFSFTTDSALNLLKISGYVVPIRYAKTDFVYGEK